MNDDVDVHSAGYNGVTEEELDDLTQIAMGRLLEMSLKAWEQYGPPPQESYVEQMCNTFGIGFAYGYRRAHIDCTMPAE